MGQERLAMDCSLEYLSQIQDHLARLYKEEKENILRAAEMVADQIAADKLIFAYGPGGHSNMGPQEIFFRAGGLMHVNAMLDEGTLLSGGALRSMAMERTPGYGKVVMDDYNLQKDDLLIIINAYGINSATIDAALEAQKRGVKTIGVTSVKHAKLSAFDHPARHPSKKNLYELVDMVLDSKVEIGDAVLEIPNFEQKIAAMSTFANAYLLNSMVSEAIAILVSRGIHPPVWQSGNSPGGDEANARFIDQFRDRIKKL